MARKNRLMASPHDGFDRYKSSKAREQAYQVTEAIGRLQSCCHRYFEKDSDPFEKWQKECISLYELFVKIPWFVHVKKEKILACLKSFLMYLNTRKGAFANCINPRLKPTDNV